MKEYYRNDREYYQPYFEYDYQDYDNDYAEQEKPTRSSNKQELSVEESVNFVNSKPNSMKSETVNVVKRPIIDCQQCDRKFYFNNKLYRHIKKCKLLPKSEVKAHLTIPLTFVIESTCKRNNFQGFAFKSHQYVTMKKKLTLKDLDHKHCMNSEIFMSLVDRIFLIKHLSKAPIYQVTSSIKIKGIGARMHDSSNHVIIDLLLFETIKNDIAIACLTAKFHLINNLKANVLVKINVMSSKDIILDCDKKSMSISTCNNIKVPMSVRKKGASINRSMRAVIQTIISAEVAMTILIKLRRLELSKNRDYTFYSKETRLLGPKGGFFTHVTDANLMAIQVQNISRRPYVMPKNFKIGHLRDYDKKEYFLATLKDCYLTIALRQSKSRNLERRKSK